MKFSRINLPLLAIVAFAVIALLWGSRELAALDPFPEVGSLEPLPIHQRTAIMVVDQVRSHHLLKDKPLNDETSSLILDQFLEDLDPMRRFFYASDVKKFEAHRHALDDALKLGRLEIPFQIYNRFNQRVKERLQWVLNRLDSGIHTFDLNTDKELLLDRENEPWPQSKEIADDIWELTIANWIIREKLKGTEPEEIENQLLSRYRMQLKRLGQQKPEDAFEMWMNAFTTTYDPHTNYFSPRDSENFEINMSLQLEGIGAVLQPDDEDYTQIRELVPGGPADLQGVVQPADRIIAVGQQVDGPMIDVVGWRLEDVVDMIRGPRGTVVVLELLTPDNDHRTAVITRDTVKLEEQAAKSEIIEIQRGDRAFRVGIIDIPTMYADHEAKQRRDPDARSTTTDVIRLIRELKAESIDGLILDVRRNGGGYLDEADSLTGLFIPSGPTVQVVHNRAGRYSHRDLDNQTEWDGPLAVVVDRYSASASEILAGAIQDYGRGLIIGSQTFGKGTVQQLLNLKRGKLKITNAKFYRISGKSTQHRGVIPDVLLPDIADSELVGESALDNAVPWDTIAAEKYDASPLDPEILKRLREKHQARTENQPDFKYVRWAQSRYKENRARTHVPINEQQRTLQRDAEDQERLEMGNALIVSKGYEPAEDLRQLKDRQIAIDNEEKDQPDAMLMESAEILVDWMKEGPVLAQVDSTEEGQE